MCENILNYIHLEGSKKKQLFLNIVDNILTITFTKKGKNMSFNKVTKNIEQASVDKIITMDELGKILDTSTVDGQSISIGAAVDTYELGALQSLQEDIQLGVLKAENLVFQNIKEKVDEGSDYSADFGVGTGEGIGTAFGAVLGLGLGTVVSKNFIGAGVGFIVGGVLGYLFGKHMASITD